MAMKYTRLLRMAFVVVAIASALVCNAAENDDIFDLTFDENLNLPTIQKAEVAERIQNFQNDRAVELIKNNLEVELTRNGEVIIVTVPADELFAPNDTVLLKNSSEVLNKFLKFTQAPGFYKLLLVMHSDNTGTPNYLNRLTGARSNAVYEWFEAHGNADWVVPYAFGGIQPLQDNTSIDKRRLNRRLEIYIVPGEEMIAQAKKGKVKQVVRKRK